MNRFGFDEEYLSALCLRVFPERASQSITNISPLSSRQHAMLAFDLTSVEQSDQQLHEPLILRHYVSRVSWWRPDDPGKAQRETTVCRWLLSEGFPVAQIFAREFTAEGDIVLLSRLPGMTLNLTELGFEEAIRPYIAPYAKLLARLHTTNPPDSVRKIVSKVSLTGALANLTALAYQIDLPVLLDAVNQVMAVSIEVREKPAVLLHGDYHFLNILVEDERISGLIDWEYSALGDPRWDVANAYMQLVDFGFAEAADRFLTIYLEHSGFQFDGPPLYNVVVPLQQWAISEWLVQQESAGNLPPFALAHELIELRDVHQRRAEIAMQWLP